MSYLLDLLWGKLLPHVVLNTWVASAPTPIIHHVEIGFETRIGATIAGAVSWKSAGTTDVALTETESGTTWAEACCGAHFTSTMRSAYSDHTVLPSFFGFNSS